MMSDSKAIFFDIDDTLCRNGKLQLESRAVLERLSLERPDIKLIVATGRSSVMLPRDILDCLKAGIFSGLICMNGRLNYWQQEEISSYPMQQEQVLKIIDLCRHYQFPYQQLSREHIAWSRQISEYEHMFLLFPAYRIDPHYYRKYQVYQLSVFLQEEGGEQEREFVSKLHTLNYELARWHKGGADLLEQGFDKTRGIADICAHLAIDIAKTIAFGDGDNDVQMLANVGCGVAMADGRPAAKNAASLICATIEENGIEQTLEALGILQPKL